jgi:hypothetical protein
LSKNCFCEGTLPPPSFFSKNSRSSLSFFGDAQGCPEDAFKSFQVPISPKKDKELLEFLEKKLGGGRVPSQKQFLDNDRKVLRFFTKSEDL